MKKIFLSVLFAILFLVFTGMSFCEANIPKIYYEDTEYFKSENIYLENDEIMVKLSDLANMLNVSFRWDDYSYSYIYGLNLYVGQNNFDNDIVNTWSVSEVTKKGDAIYVPLKAVCNALLYELVEDGKGSIHIKKLEPPQGKTLKLVYDTRNSGHLIKQTVIDELDYSYEEQFNHDIEKYIKVVLIKDIFADEDKNMGLSNDYLNLYNKFYVQYQESGYKEEYDLNQIYQEIELYQGNNRIYAVCEDFSNENSQVLSLNDVPDYLYKEDLKEKLEKIVTSETKIALFVLEGLQREKKQTIKIVPKEGYEEILIVVSTSNGQDIVIENPHQAKIMGILLGHKKPSGDLEGGHRLISYDKTIPVFHTSTVPSIISYYRDQVEPWLETGQNKDDAESLYETNEVLFELTGKDISSVAYEKDNVTELGQYLDVQMNELKAHFEAIEAEHQAQKQSNFEKNVKEREEKSKQVKYPSEFSTTLSQLISGVENFRGYYLNELSGEVIKELGAYSLNQHRSTSIPIELSDINEGLLYFKGEFTFNRPTKKKLNSGATLPDFQMFVDGEILYHNYMNREPLVEFPKGKHLVEVFYKYNVDHTQYSHSLGITEPYSYMFNFDESLLKEDLSNGTKVYCLELLDSQGASSTVIDLKNYSGKMVLVLKTVGHTDWEIINTDQVDLKTVISTKPHQTTINIDSDEAVKVYYANKLTDEVFKQLGIEKFNNYLYYSCLDYTDNLDGYDFSQTPYTLKVEDKIIDFTGYEFPPLLLHNPYGNGEMIIALEALADALSFNYRVDDTQSKIFLSSKDKTLVYDKVQNKWSMADGSDVYFSGNTLSANGHYYVELSDIAPIFSYFVKWHSDLNESILIKADTEIEEWFVKDKIPATQYRVYKYEDYGITKYVETYLIDGIEAFVSEQPVYGKETLILQKVMLDHNQTYRITVGESDNFCYLKYNAQLYDFGESIELKKGENLLYYYFEENYPTKIELDVIK